MDCRGKGFGQGHHTIVRVQAAKSINRARQGDRVDPLYGHGGQTPCAQDGGIKTRRRAARSVQRNNLIRLGGFHQHEAIPANAGHLRFGDAKDKGPRDSGVNGVSPAFQDVDRHLRSNRVRGGANTVGSIDGRPAGQVKIAHCIPQIEGKLSSVGRGRKRQTTGGVPRIGSSLKKSQFGFTGPGFGWGGKRSQKGARGRATLGRRPRGPVRAVRIAMERWLPLRTGCKSNSRLWAAACAVIPDALPKVPLAKRC